MTWEAFRLTSRSPAEVYHILGPHGVDDLMRKMMDACWREYPEEKRTFDDVTRRVMEVYNRNMKTWSAIKKPTPQAFFVNMLPYAADGHMRQALVLTWMMMPRAGGRVFGDVKKIVAHIFERNLEAWKEDNRTFTSGQKKSAARKIASKKRVSPKPITRSGRAKPRTRKT